MENKRLRDYDKRVTLFLPQELYDIYKDTARNTKCGLNNLLVTALVTYAMQYLTEK